MEILKTIVPIFAIALIGLLAKKRGVITPAFMGPANKLTFHYAIPALVIRAILNGDFRTQFDIRLVAGALLPMLGLFLLAWLFAWLLRLPAASRGTFIESAVHGNIGYIGLAVVYYFLGSEALALAGVLAGFMMLFHNLLAVIALQYFSGGRSEGGLVQTGGRVLANPIILSATLGILLSALRVPIPDILDRTLDILGSFALPLALMLIGASLSLKLEAGQKFMVIVTGIFKLLLLPAAGYACYVYFELPKETYLPGLILLASPVATVAYVMACELDGDEKLAVSIISSTTALSAITISIWLALTAS